MRMRDYDDYCLIILQADHFEALRKHGRVYVFRYDETTIPNSPAYVMETNSAGFNDLYRRVEEIAPRSGLLDRLKNIARIQGIELK